MNKLTKYAPLALGVLRIVVALLFIEHGTQKLLGFPASPMFAHGVPPLLMVAGVLELVGGIMVLVGAFVRPVAFILAGEMAFAYWTFHFPHGGFFPAVNGGDAAIMFCFIFLYFFFAGGGALSIDAKRAGGAA